MMKLMKRVCAMLLIAGIVATSVPAATQTVEAASYDVYKNITYSSLTSKQKNIYNDILKVWKNSKKSVVTKKYHVSESDFLKARDAMQNVYFRYSSGLFMTSTRYYHTSTGKTAYIQMKLYPAKTRARRTRHLENQRKLKSIAKSVTKGKKTTRQKVIAINNYVCKKLTWRNNAGTLDIALRTKYAKCTGYASLFMALCEMSNIKCCQVAGYANGGHDWNQVKIGKSWYYVDPTWNDSSRNKYLISKKLWSDHTKIWAKIYVINFQQCGYKFDI